MFDLLDDQRREFRDTLREFCRKEVMPGAAHRDAAAEYPATLIARLADMGLMGITVPEEYGGLGLDMVTQVLAMEEVAYADASLGSVFAGHYLGMEALRQFGSPDQRERHLPGLATGSYRVSFALTEPDAGSDVSRIRTRATAGPDGWTLTGNKTFTSNARESDAIIVFAMTDPGAGIKGITAFLVPTGAPGLGFSAPIEKLGIRGEHAYEVSLDGVHVGPDAMVGESGGGGRIALEVLNSARIDVAALANGVAMRALDLATGYASTRVQFGRPIRELQAIQLMLAEIDALVQSGRLHAYHAAALRDRSEDVRRAGSLAKYVASENCFSAVDRALQIHGGYGYVKESEIERLYRDCRIFRIYEGTSQIQLLTVAKLLGRLHDEHGTVV
ncbi:acyl-CoA dehydrogenase family protein [Spongiactinospora sp. TRM90649]|uniref:acyl-CoA dehydrogenase family protein n=1 Tax=Spongiactinospora sp. TRM90649 TaxID=3031114 RepID=UPI0023F916F4|nr:acyl-CoA dehydrogenase family protein [Spongiactinospora sp. TRM90649]MDF5757726.1 acyl-CoA dehydrogenase family protein [Spongiactinospora sp. TRM90649]